MSEFRRRLMMHGSGTGGKYIKFKDPVVEQICISKWSSDGIGLTHEDAAKVIKLDYVFRQNNDIRYFDELKHFSSITETGGEFYNSDSLSTISLPANLSYIGTNSFLNCDALVSVEVPYGINSIDDGAFNGCKSLKNINIPNGVTIIKNEAFRDCSSLVTLFLPNSLIHIGNNTFWGAGISGHVDIPVNVTSIGLGAFRECVKLTSVRILGEVGSIGRTCFYNTPLQHIVIYSINPPLIGDLVFNPTTTIYVLDESVEAYKTAENWINYASRIKPLSEYQEQN